GHIGYSFYMIFSGGVVVRTAASTDAGSESVRLRKGDAFGERALLLETNRNATVTTETQLTELLIIYDECFAESGLAAYFRARVEQTVQFLRRVPLLSSLASPARQPAVSEDGSRTETESEPQSVEPEPAEAKINSLASSCVQLDYLDGCQIVSDSRRTDCVWFLMSGSADCYRLLNEPDCLMAKVGRLVPGSAF
uniref:Cyclic nucleotide-binding domain-containing protein n=1 Tax=Macrostomum lignano TaxID=282301 RepID=A0A1I8J6C5_9PLAT